MKDIKGIIFDLDGVIIHTDELHYKAWKVIADKYEIPFDKNDNNRLRGVSRMESLEIILEKSKKKYKVEEKEEMAYEKNNIYKNLLSLLSIEDVDPEVIKTLIVLRENGFKLAIGSSSKNAVMILKSISLFEKFDAVSDGNNISNSKPHPEVFIKAAQFISLKENECAVVEDARSGIDAAIAGGFKCFGIGDSYSYEKATWKIKSLGEILKVLNL